MNGLPDAPLLGKIPDPVRLAFTLPMEVDKPCGMLPSPAAGVADGPMPGGKPCPLAVALLASRTLLAPARPDVVGCTAAAMAAFCFSMVQSNV